ncbi:hypothetical protein CPT32_28265 [Rhizobium sophoriradicis]|nr:hypothetical protein CPT32_28265 [Rhizobium sophoriradicis]
MMQPPHAEHATQRITLRVVPGLAFFLTHAWLYLFGRKIITGRQEQQDVSTLANGMAEIGEDPVRYGV